MHPGKEVRSTALKLGDVSERKEPGTQRSKKENVTLSHLRDTPLWLTLDPHYCPCRQLPQEYTEAPNSEKVRALHTLNHYYNFYAL